MKYALASFIALIISISSFAQKGKEYFLIDSVNYEGLSPDDKILLDSLLRQYHEARHDTARLNTLEIMAEIFTEANLWLRYNHLLYKRCKQVLKNTSALSKQEIKTYKRCYAKALHNYGYYAYNFEEDDKKSIAYYDSCLSMQDEVNDKITIAATYNNIAIIFQNQGNVSAALENFLTSLKIEEEIDDKSAIANSLNNIASVYMIQGDTSKALENLKKSIAICKEINFDRGIAFAMSNMGAIYRDQKNYPEALKYFQSSVPIWEKIGEKMGLGFAMLSTGFIYQKFADASEKKLLARDSLYNLSMEYFQKAIKAYEEINNRQGLSHTFSSIGNCYFSQNNLPKAIEYGTQALKLGKEIGYPGAIRSASELLFKSYKKQGKSKEALSMHELFIQMRDSIFNEETHKSTFKQQTKYEYEKQQAISEAEHQKELAIADEEKKRQKIVTYSIASGLLLVIAFAIFIFNRLRITRRQKQIIEHQKKIVDQKNKHITDSINYAKRIQDSILPSKEELSTCFSDYFIFFRPREIVSGDFYWLSTPSLSHPKLGGEPERQGVILAIADCTGHGVPGAFMSMIGNTLLNEIVNEKNIYQPNEILNHLNEGIVNALHQESRSQDDGMDISVCLFDKEKNKITFAGANHSMYIIENNSLHEIKGDIYSIGSMFGKKNFSFAQQEINLSKNSSIYFSTDGFADQVGGANGKKLLVKQLEKILLSVASLEIKEQEEKIKKTFEEWKGNYSQLDDVLLAGIKF